MKIWMCEKAPNQFSKSKLCDECYSVAVIPLAEYRLILAESKAGREYYKWRDHGELSPYKNKASGHFGETIGKLDAWRNQKGRVM